MRPARAAWLLVVLLFRPGAAHAREVSGTPVAPRSGLHTTNAPGRESFAERRAVRGIAVEGADASESPELRTLRRFEESAFPRSGAPHIGEPDDAAATLPPGLRGRWGGSGDIPRELRSPEPAVPNSLARPRLDWLRQLSLPELPVRWEPQVLRYLEFFKDDPKGRAIMTTWLRRMGRYRAIIDRKLDEQGLPRDLVYLAMVESGFDPGAVSARSAGGIWQFIPGAARAYGLEVSNWVDARRDPERATEAAARMLKDLYVRFGSWPLAFAAYNAGYGAILRSIARFNTNDFWELTRHEAGLPWETALYVPKILATAIIGHNLKIFGFGDIVPDAGWEFDRAEVPAGISFAALARTVGARPDVIEDLNPEYIAVRVPPDRPSVVLRIPLGSAATLAKVAADLRLANERLQTVVLRFGETLDDVAKARGCSVRELKRINAVNDTSELRGGMTILVPMRSVPPVAPDKTANKATDKMPDAAPDDSILVAVPERSFAYPSRERVFYRTRDGDTLADIAATFDVTLDNIVEWNNIDPEAKLQPKLILQLFVAEGFDRSGVMLLDNDRVRIVTLGSEEFLELEAARRGKTRLFYSARPGDTLARIAKRYGLAPGDLARINRLSSTSELTEGQRVVVYSPTPELPKEITAKVTGAPKKGALALKDAGIKGGKGLLPKSTATAATAKSAAAKPSIPKPTSTKPAPTKLAAGIAKPSKTPPAPAKPSGGKR